MKSLPKVPNRSTTYYKITNEEEIHNGLRYYNGLIIDYQKFNSNSKDSCVPGGIYFTTKKCLHKFFKYNHMIGAWIRPVTIPKSARVVLDPDGDKYRANKLFLHPRKSIKFYFNNLFDKRTFPKDDYNYLVKDCPDHFNKWFGKRTFPKKYYWRLAVNCPDRFNKWFDKRTFPKEFYCHLAQYCSNYFNEWFNKKAYPKEDYYYLIKYCPNHFDEWFDEETFPRAAYKYLAERCPEQLSIKED